MNADRDTQFKGFAEALFEDLGWDDINIDMSKNGWEERWMTTIAQRAFDLVEHACKIHHDYEVMKHACSTDKQPVLIPPHDYMLARIPDLPELPHAD